MHGRHVGDATRCGVVTEVKGVAGEPPYVVRWDGGQEAQFFPGLGARVDPARPALGMSARALQLADRPIRLDTPLRAAWGVDKAIASKAIVKLSADGVVATTVESAPHSKPNPLATP